MWNLLFNIMECGNMSFRFKAFGAIRLRLIWCYLFYNLEQDIHYFILYKKDKLHHNYAFHTVCARGSTGKQENESLLLCESQKSYIWISSLLTLCDF